MEPEKLIGELKIPEQMFEFPTTPIVGVGFTYILKATGVPWQLFEMGVTTKLAVIGKGDKLVVVKAAILPVPENPIPIKLFSFVQLYWVLLAVKASILPVPDKGSVPTPILVLVQLKTEPGVEEEVKIT
jgi:hypothetical protein